MHQNWHDKIEAYVEGDLSASERKEMEAAMRNDPALAKEVRVWQLEQEALLQLRLKKVREQFAERSRHLFEEQKPEPLRVAWYRSPWVRMAAVLVPLMVAIWWFMQEPEDVEPTVANDRTEVDDNTTLQQPETVIPEIDPIPQSETSSTKTNPRKPRSTTSQTPRSTPLLASITIIPGSNMKGGGSGNTDSLLTKAEVIFHNKGSVDSCYQFIQAQEQAWLANPPDDNKVYLKLMVLKTWVLDGLGRQEEAIRFLQTYIDDPTPRTGVELIWRDLPRLLQVLLQKPLDKAKAQKMLDDLLEQQDGRKYINFAGPFLDDLNAQLNGQ